MGVYACIVLLVVGEALMSAGQLELPPLPAARLYRQAKCRDCLCSLQAKVEDRKINAILFGSDDVFKKQIFNCTDQRLPIPYYYPSTTRCSCTEDKEPVVECEAKIWRLQPIKHKTVNTNNTISHGLNLSVIYNMNFRRENVEGIL